MKALFIFSIHKERKRSPCRVTSMQRLTSHINKIYKIPQAPKIYKVPKIRKKKAEGKKKILYLDHSRARALFPAFLCSPFFFFFSLFIALDTHTLTDRHGDSRQGYRKWKDNS